MCTPRKSSDWLSPFPFSGRSSYAPQPSDSSDILSVALHNPAILLSSVSTEKDDIWDDEDHETDQERKRFSSLTGPLFHRPTLEESPPSSPSMSDAPSDDDDLESFVPLQHPHPVSHAAPRGPLHLALEDDNSSVFLEATGPTLSDQESEITLNPTPSCMPTIIASRSPSPGPHSCVAEAEALRIKVRDFAYEEHGVPLARPVPDIETLKSRYQLYRSAELTPPPGVVETLRDYDEMWLTEKTKYFDEKEREDSSEPMNSRRSWRRRRGEFFRGPQGGEAVAIGRYTSGESCATEGSSDEITAELEQLTVKTCGGEDIVNLGPHITVDASKTHRESESTNIRPVFVD